jgi:hypothetical protein
MQFAIHGLGTVLYGKRDYWPDGSFVTTEWAVLAYVPIFPTFSKRISYTKNSDFAAYDASGYYVYETTTPNLRQVAYVYGWFAAMIATVVVYASCQAAIARLVGDEDTAAGIWLVLLAVEASLPYLLRRLAWRRKLQEWRRASIGLGPPPLG